MATGTIVMTAEQSMKASIARLKATVEAKNLTKRANKKK
jgi:hypothetical protein